MAVLFMHTGSVLYKVMEFSNQFYLELNMNEKNWSHRKQGLTDCLHFSSVNLPPGDQNLSTRE